MEEITNLILEIYRAARTMPADVYQEFVLGMERTLVPFDSSRWVSIEYLESRAKTHSVHLINEPTDLVLDWEAINHQDKLLHNVANNPGRAFAIHSSTLYKGRQFVEILDYARRYQHTNVLSIGQYTQAQNHAEGISLYRAKEENHFSRENQRILECLTSHMVEGLITNRVLALARIGATDLAPERSPTAIAHRNGVLHFAGSGFNALMRMEWPEWPGHTLPKPLLEAVTRPGSEGYFGKVISVAFNIHGGDLIILKARRPSPIQQLTQREMMAAHLYSSGRSHKEIADVMNISPNTAKTFLQRIYSKLDIKNKAELAVLMAQQKDS